MEDLIDGLASADCEEIIPKVRHSVLTPPPSFIITLDDITSHN